DLPEAAALPPAEADEEGERSGRGGEAGRLGIEAEEGSVGRRLSGERGESRPIDRQQGARSLDPHERPACRPYQLAVERGGQSLGTDRAGTAGVRWRERCRCLARRDPSAKVRKSPLEPDRGDALGHAGTASMLGAVPGRAVETSAASSRRARCLPLTSGSRRGPVQAGQPASQAHASISARAPVMSSSWRLYSRSDRPIPPGTASYR